MHTRTHTQHDRTSSFYQTLLIYHRQSLYQTSSYRCMHKASTPGDRKFALHEIPKLMTELEIAMPQNWSTMVVHVYTFHSVFLMMLAGPFCVSNMFKVSAPSHSIFHQVKIGRMMSVNRTASVNRMQYVFLLSYTHRLSSFTPSSRNWPGALGTRWLLSATTTCCSLPQTSPD